MRKKYSDANLDQDIAFTVNLQKFIYGLASRSASEQEVLREAVRFIYHSFGFKEITIPLRSPADGKYRYEAFLGMTREAEQSYRKLIYDREDVFDDDTYPGVKLSKHTELALAELEPYIEGEEGTYNRPTMLKEQRKSVDQMLDSDYYSVYLIGPGDDAFGWLELSGYKDGKFPPMKIVRQLELFSTILSLILSQWRSAPKKTGAQNARAR
jgi:hypothetical protein